MNYFEIIVAVFKGVWSLKNIRLSLIFKGQDYAQSEGDNPITTDEEAWTELGKLETKEQDALINTKYDIPLTEDEVNAAVQAGKDPFKIPRKKISLKESTWDKWSLEEKVFYVELKRNNAIDAAAQTVKKAKTQSEEFLESIENLKIETEYFGTLNVGKYIGWTAPIINFLFSPTLMRIIAVAASIALLFTPLGYGVGALAMTVGLASVAFDIYRYTAKYRELNSVKEESVLLNELKKESSELEKTMGKSTEAFRKIIATTMPGHGINPATEAPSLLNAAGYTLVGAYSNMVVATTLSLATLNPIPLLASMLMMVTGYSVTTSMYYQFDKRFTYLSNANAVMKAELGLEQGFVEGGRNNYLSNHLNMMRCYNLAVAEVAKDPEAKKLNPDSHMLRQKLVEAFNREARLAEEARKSSRPSFLEDTWTLLKDGVSWVDVNRRFTPSLMEDDVVKHHSKEKFMVKVRHNQPEINKEPLVEVQKTAEVVESMAPANKKPDPESVKKGYVDKIRTEHKSTNTRG